MRIALSILVVLSACLPVDAGGRRSAQPAISYALASPVGQTAAECRDALDEVNAWRARHGLRPFAHDVDLTAAAYGAAKWRAEHLWFWHVPGGDYKFLPPGCPLAISGCAAYPPRDGWLSCCMDDVQYKVAGAAWVMGRDGRRFMHLFVR